MFTSNTWEITLILMLILFEKYQNVGYFIFSAYYRYTWIIYSWSHWVSTCYNRASYIFTLGNIEKKVILGWTFLHLKVRQPTLHKTSVFVLLCFHWLLLQTKLDSLTSFNIRSISLHTSNNTEFHTVISFPWNHQPAYRYSSQCTVCPSANQCLSANFIFNKTNVLNTVKLSITTLSSKNN